MARILEAQRAAQELITRRKKWGRVKYFLLEITIDSCRRTVQSKASSRAQLLEMIASQPHPAVVAPSSALAYLGGLGPANHRTVTTWAGINGVAVKRPALVAPITGASVVASSTITVVVGAAPIMSPAVATPAVSHAGATCGTISA